MPDALQRNGERPVIRRTRAPHHQSRTYASPAGVVVTWQRPGRDRLAVPAKRELRPGQVFWFGITDRAGGVDPEPANPIGRVDAADGSWYLSNLTSSATFAIENMEDGAELVKAAPRRMRIAVPFEMSRVSIPVCTGLVEISVFGTAPEVLVSGLEEGPQLPPLDHTSKYFLVLVALCEPRLRGSSMSAVPSVQEIVERLRPLDQFKDINRNSVNYHIDYLRTSKLPVEQWATSAGGGRLHSKREALVAFALRYDVVTEQDLARIARPTTRP